MPFLFEPIKPVEIPAVYTPAPGKDTEQRDALCVLKLLLESEGLQTHPIDFGSHTTHDFDIFQTSSVHAPPVAGRMLVAANTLLYMPNEEGRPGDITVQRDISTHEMPGIVVGQDTDVLVIAQRLRAGLRYAATAALAIEDLSQGQLDNLTVRYGAY